jgi:hypothetical protein
MCFYIPSESHYPLVALTDILVYKYLICDYRDRAFSPYQGAEYIEGKMKTSRMKTVLKSSYDKRIDMGLHCYYAQNMKNGSSYYGGTQFKMTVPKGATFWIDNLRKEIVTNKLYFGVTKTAQPLTDIDVRDMMLESRR